MELCTAAEQQKLMVRLPTDPCVWPRTRAAYTTPVRGSTACPLPSLQAVNMDAFLALEERLGCTSTTFEEGVSDTALMTCTELYTAMLWRAYIEDHMQELTPRKKLKTEATGSSSVCNGA